MNSSINSILNIARSAIFANQTGVRVASANIANAQSDGYTRQTIRMVESRPDLTPIGRLGTGVSVYGVSRVRDGLLDATFRQESGKAEGYALRQEVLGRVEQVFGEPSESGLAATLDAFWNAWSDLANRPANPTARRTVQQMGAQVADTLRSFDSRLNEVEEHTRRRLVEAVQNVNGIAEQVAQLNQEIVRAEGSGHEAHDLRDQRDVLLDRLSAIGGVRTLDRGNGAVAVMFEGAMLVDGSRAKTLSASGSPPTVAVAGLPLSYSGDGSALGELVRTLSDDLPGVRSRLDTLAAEVVGQVNALHTAGFDSAGAAGVDFFDPAGTTAATISLSAEVAGDPTLVATSDAAGETTNNRIALAISALKGRPADNSVAAEVLADWATVSGGLDGSSFAEYYEDVVAETALGVRAAEHSASVFRTIAEQADARRQSVSGVSTDEELIKLMSFQQAYTAATKVVTTVDEMLQAVLAMV